jgi:hypothetical protein
VNAEILCDKRELEWKSGGLRFNPGRYMKYLLEIITEKRAGR